jgi:chloramphenicol O-acetyltransferase
MHPFAFVTQTAENEVFYFHQAMQEDNCEDFIQAMIKELEDHISNNHWRLVKRSKIGENPTIKEI